MILKMWKDRPYGSGIGWVYLDKVSQVLVDRTCYCIAKSMQELECAIVCGVSDAGTPNRSMTIDSHEKLFEAWDVVKDFHDDQICTVRLLTVRFENGNYEMYVSLLGEPSAWLMSDEGKTVDRLS